MLLVMGFGIESGSGRGFFHQLNSVEPFVEGSCVWEREELSQICGGHPNLWEETGEQRGRGDQLVERNVLGEAGHPARH